MFTEPNEICLPSSVRVESPLTSVVVPPEYSADTAVTTANMPRVTMNGGSRSRVTRNPEIAAIPPATRIPTKTAADEAICIDSLAMTMVANTMIAPLARSIPAVRMTKVWPRARVPTTTVWPMIVEKLSRLKNVLVAIEKKMIAMIRAAVGPRAGDRAKISFARSAPLAFGGAMLVLVPVLGLLLVVVMPPPLAKHKLRVRIWGLHRARSSCPADQLDRTPSASSPAVGQAPGGVLRRLPGDGLVGDQRGAGVHLARGLGAGLGELDDRVHAVLGHHLRKLHDGGDELAVLDVLHPGTAAVDRTQRH